uniref:Reverse transcriptase domain-containing protein n=1 Tax=Magallana gigas TaxID=29159 RepID=A0A8W8L5Q8_MAGGI
MMSFSRSNNDNLPGGHITGKEILEIVKDLKRRKAPGLDRIQNEHVIYGGPALANCIAYLFNGIINAGQIPTSWKKDLIVPIFKGSNKPRNSPGSYRPIALLPCFLKIFEKLLLNRTKLIAAISATFPNLQQQGFQQRLGCITASFNLQETLYHFIEHRSTAYVAFLDTQKAFDTVWRHGLMYKLHKLGVKGRLWTLIDDCHVNTSCSVVSNQSYSDWFPVSQGVRQALSPNGLQTTLEISYDYSKRWRFNFNATKSSILRFHPSEPPSDFSFIWQLGAHSVHLAKTYNHLGILLHSKLDPSERTANACRKGKAAYFALKVSEHLNPRTISKLYKKVVLPSVLYGSELWCDLRQTDTQILNTFQHFICQHAMALQKQTRSDMCESLLGFLPISSEIDIRKLQFLGRLCELDTKTLPKRIFLHRLFSYLYSPVCKLYGFIPDIISILSKYSLLNHLLLYLDEGYFPPKPEWKIIVKASVLEYHLHSRHIPPETCLLCNSSFTNVFEHVTTSCAETLLLRDAWWNTIINEFSVELSADLCGLNQRDSYLFLLGARSFSAITAAHDSNDFHLFNFRFVRDAAA